MAQRVFPTQGAAEGCRGSLHGTGSNRWGRMCCGWSPASSGSTQTSPLPDVGTPAAPDTLCFFSPPPGLPLSPQWSTQCGRLKYTFGDGFLTEGQEGSLSARVASFPSATQQMRCTYLSLPQHTGAMGYLFVTWSSWAQLALLLLGESPATWLPDCLGSTDPGPTDKRGTLAIAPRRAEPLYLGKPAVWEQGSLTLGKEGGASSSSGGLDGERWWSSLSQCCMEVGAEARLPYANGWMAACSLMWEESIKTLHQS